MKPRIIHSQLDACAEELLRLVTGRPSIIDRVHDVMSQLTAEPGGTSYDQEPRGSVPWCDTHEQEVSACHRDDHLCRGIPLARITDPTGEAAVNIRVYEDERSALRHAAIIRHSVNELVRIHAHYLALIDTDPNEAARLEAANAAQDGCEVCARSDKWVPAIVDNGCSDILRRPMRLCRWHHDFVTDHRRLPDDREEALHQAGRRVTVRQTERLATGLVTGKLGKAG